MSVTALLSVSGSTLDVLPFLNHSRLYSRIMGLSDEYQRAFAWTKDHAINPSAL